jgi:tetratricopeptide (TPR) repeat protein
MTRPAFRWAVAVLVTIAAFAAATWICGAFALPIRDGAVRWVIAASLGLAVAALAALWGNSYATAERQQPAAEGEHADTAGTGNTYDTISGGAFHGPVTQAREIDALDLTGWPTAGGTQTPPPAADTLPPKVIRVTRYSDDHTSNDISDGVFFSAVIQGRDITMVLPPHVTPAMAGLPAASAAFTGRSQDLDSVLQMLTPLRDRKREAGGCAAGAVVVTAVCGMGGIGKTELAVQAAHAALGRGWFAGGVLFADMFGYDTGRRLTAAQAAAGFLHALGIPGEHIPADAQDLSRLLRSALDAYAAQGRPVLMVIDNVSDQAQAAPLLPAHPVCRAIVTSRHTLGLLDARLVDLDTLNVDQAVELLGRAVNVARPGDRRIADHPGDARQVAGACGGLPLALRIVAALLADNPDRPLAAMASDLDDQAGRLAELSYGSDALTTVFDLSYQHLPADQARMFRLLSASPGPDIATIAAATVVGLTEAETRRLLEALARAHLIESGSTYGRWRMHDLIRLHSAHHGDTHTDVDQRPEALARLLEHYLATTRAAKAHLGSAAADPRQLGFHSREQALAWLDAEYPNLTVATFAAAADPRYLTVARDLPAAMWDFLLLRRHFNDWVTLSQTALTAARALHDPSGQATALAILGAALFHVRRFDEAITACQQAARIYRDAGDRHSEGRALNFLGNALREVRRFDEAITAHEEAAQIYRDTGDRHREGRALNNLGIALREVRRFDEAITAHEEAAQIYRDTGDRHREGKALNNLGNALREVRRFDEAITAHEEAAQIFRDTGDRHREGRALNNLGIALREVRRFDEANTAHEEAAQTFRDTGDRQSEGIALNNLQETRQAQDGEPGTPELGTGSNDNAR